MMKGNMADAEKGLRQNRGQGLRVRLAEMLVTNFLFQKSHCIFFRVDFYCGVKHLKLLYALKAWGTVQQVCEFRD